MVDLVAFTYSDVTTVTEILSEIAMIFDGNAFLVAAKVAALVGIVAALFGALGRGGGGINPSTFFWPILISTLMLVPKVNLVVEDRAGGIARIDNLPVGFAGPISLITQFGEGVATMMTENLGLDDNAVTMDNGHLVALRAPSVYTQILTDPNFQGLAATFPNGLAPVKDTSNYIKSCLAWANKGTGSMALFRTTPIDDMNVGNAPHTVGTTDGRVYECSDLYNALMQGFESEGFQDRLNDSVAQFFGKYKDDTTTAGRYQAALEELVGDLPEFYKAAVFSVALTRASAEITTAAGSGSHLAALRDALNQKLEKNYGAAAMIFETISGTIGFIEVWSYSIMPLALLLLISGSVGTKIGVKYLWMLVWVQLWYPTLLVVIAYLDVKARSIAFGASATVSSYEAFMSQIMRLQDVGYMNMSMATALSMFLVFGTSSAVAANFQKDTTGADYYDPKKNAPDTLSRSALNEFKPHYSFSQSVGGGQLGVSSDAERSFAGMQISLDRSRSSAVTATQLASFAATGTMSSFEGVGSGTAVADGRTNTDALAAAAGTSGTSSQSRTMSAGQGGQLTGNTGVNATKDESVAGSASLGAQASANADVDLGGVVGKGGALAARAAKGAANFAKGLGSEVPNGSPLPAPPATATDTKGTGKLMPLAAGVGGLVRAGAELRNTATKGRREEVGAGDSVTQDVRLGSSVTASANETQSNSHTLTQAKSQSQTNTNEQREGTETRDSVAHASSETKSLTGADMTVKRASGTVSLVTAAANIAGDSASMRRLHEAVASSGISNDVEQFMYKNRDKLDATYSSTAAGENAKFALAATYVMQGFNGQLFSGDLKNGQARRDAVNALSDDIIASTTFGAKQEVQGAPSLANLGNYEDVDPGKVKNGALAAGIQFALRKDDAEAMLSSIPQNKSGTQMFAQMESLMGRKFDTLAPGAVNGILSTMRANIDKQMGPMEQNTESFAQLKRDVGFVGAVQNMLWKDNMNVRREAVMDGYKGALDHVQGDFFTKDTTPQAASSVGGKMIEGRMAVLNGAGVASKDDEIGRYMALSQLEVGAREFGHGNLANFFEQERKGMEYVDPVLGANTMTAARISALAMTGASGEAMGDAYLRARQEYKIGEVEQAIEQQTRMDVNSEGVGVTWAPSSLSSGKAGAINAQDMIEYMVNEKGMRRHEAMGFVRNAMDESGLVPAQVEIGSGAGIGLFQHTGDRRDKLEAYLAGRGTTMEDWRAQIDFVTDVELKGSHQGTAAALARTNTEAEAAIVVLDTFEKPRKDLADARRDDYRSFTG